MSGVTQLQNFFLQQEDDEITDDSPAAEQDTSSRCKGPSSIKPGKVAAVPSGAMLDEVPGWRCLQSTARQ